MDIYNLSSLRRHPVLADLFHRMHFMERRGSGLKDIIKETAKLHGYNESLKPEFKSTHSNFWVIFKNANYDVIKNDPVNLTEREKRILEIISNEHTVSGDSLLRDLNCSVSTIRRELRKLTEYEILSRKGSDKDGLWIIRDYK